MKTPHTVQSVDAIIEQIGIATYGGKSFEPTGMYREKLTNIITQDRTTLRDTLLAELEEREKKIRETFFSHGEYYRLQELNEAKAIIRKVCV